METTSVHLPDLAPNYSSWDFSVAVIQGRTRNTRGCPELRTWLNVVSQLSLGHHVSLCSCWASRNNYRRHVGNTWKALGMSWDATAVLWLRDSEDLDFPRCWCCPAERKAWRRMGLGPCNFFVPFGWWTLIQGNFSSQMRQILTVPGFFPFIIWWQCNSILRVTLIHRFLLSDQY